MKLKEINRTAIQSWSPAQHHPVYLAAGTSAQQLDASFSTTASLEIFELDLADPSLDMKLRGAYSSSHRYHKLAWGPHGMDAQGLPSGVLIAGGENGDVILYDPAKIIAGHSDVVIAQSDKHSGPVRALDVNSFQTNLVASGGNESEIYIWDLNNFGSPMTPGPKTQPLEDISCVAWNRQVQHILASASPSGRASIWDLRKNDLIIKVSDHSNRMHCSGLEWNPEVATQLVLASEDDRMPVIQIWDLRFATSPLKVLENHTRGVLAIAWSLADPELLLSCGKDNRILCWNPNTAEVLYELPTSTQWCFDIQWCPRNPAVLSAAAFDGHISIYSIMGGSSQAFSQTQADTISTSFGNMDPFGMGQTLPPLQLPKAPAAHTTITPLKKPPKWIRRPVGASFAFGGKLVSLENIKPNPQQPQQPTAHVVHISQVITETTFLERSAQLQDTLAAGSFIDFCQEKIDSAQNEFEKTVWSFLKVNFENDTRGKYLELLGYKKEELAAKIAAALEGEPIQPEEPAPAPVPTSDPELEAEPGPEVVPIPAPQLSAEPEVLPPMPEAAVEATPEPPLEPALQPEPGPQPELAPPLSRDLSPSDPMPVLQSEPVPTLDLSAEPQLLAPVAPIALLPESDPALALPADLQQVPVFDPTASFTLQPPTEFNQVNSLPVSEFDQVALQHVLEFDLVALQPVSQFNQVDLQPVSAFNQVDLQPVSDLTNLQPVPGFDPMSSMPSLQPAAQLDLVPPPVPTLQPLADPGLLSTDLPPEDAFDLIAATNLQQAAELELTPAPEPEAEDPFDLIAATNLQQAAEPELTPAPEPEAEDPFDLIAATNLQQAAEPELTPAPEPEAEDPFDLIAAANLQQAAELEVTGALEPVAAEVDLTEAEAPEAEPIAQEEMPVDEEIPLEEEVAPPVEEEDSLPEEAPAPVPEGVKLCVSQGVDGLITQALLTGDFEGAVELCLHDNRMADSIILAIAGGAELLEKTQRKYFTKTHSKITKLISAVVMRDWRDVLQTCELQNWKEALAAVMTYAQPEEFSSLCDLLGCRLEAVEDSTLQAQACLCYICAGNVEKLVSCWTRAQDRHCPLSLQDLVEKVVVLRRAVEQTQESGPSAVGLLLGEKMSQYASLLASQGSLTTAIAYLPQNTEQVAVLQLRDRLSRALGQQAPAAGPALTPVAQVQPQLPSPQPRQLFAPAQPSMVSQQPAPAPVPAAAPAPQQYYQPVRSASTVTSWSNQTPTALPSVPPPPPHLGPATTEPQAQPTPAMYGMPPTGSAAPPDSSAAAYPPMYSHQYQPYPPASQYNPGTGGPAIYSPLQYSTPPPPSFSSSSPQAPAPGFMPQYTQQPLYPPPSMGQPVSSAPPSHPPFSPPPLSSGASFQHGGPGSPASYMPPLPPTGSSGTQPDPASQRTGPQNGWNDPPTLSRVPKKKKVPENYTPPSPITAPIFSPLGAGDPQQPPSMPPGQAQNQAPYQGMQQQQQMAPPPMNPGMLKTRGGSVEGAPGAPIGDVIHPLQSIPAEKITKKPIPEEHLILKSTFEGLIQKCLAAATDPQTKRKLDDANKRLEALYDKLREQTLSPAIVGGLHNMVQCIESRSYMESLNIHTHIVSSSNFSETSAFMPVLKVVLTQANKLGV
ncbi:protein transport protein Sec31A isoform X3 [Coregonus clupeaformis]|uniref:protein transport protein Sec31A isoform X3 n=1 Tax=Coregonus clupeaformis TaxID=59861 RepID=UPI001E1C7397|nr:protein transport protein Sec31A isoform X3 [Coregonus clupeaformis]